MQSAIAPSMLHPLDSELDASFFSLGTGATCLISLSKRKSELSFTIEQIPTAAKPVIARVPSEEVAWLVKDEIVLMLSAEILLVLINKTSF